MKKLYIVGAGGFGREVLNLFLEVESKDYKFESFLDIENGSATIGSSSYSILKEEEFFKTSDFKEKAIVVAIGDPIVLQKIVDKYKNLGVQDFPNLIHPYTHISASAKLGQGNIICNSSILSIDVTMGNFNIINLNCTIGHDVKMENFNIINPGCNLSGGLSIGSNNLFGTNSTVLQNLEIGNKSIIGAGSMVNKNVENSVTLVGNPSRVMKKNIN